MELDLQRIVRRQCRPKMHDTISVYCRLPLYRIANVGAYSVNSRSRREDAAMSLLYLGSLMKAKGVGHVGGHKIIRSYWRNYFKQTDGLVWVVDSSDLRRPDDRKYELHNLMKMERLSGASLLIFANKQDIQGALSPAEIAKVLNLEAMDNSRH
uniref:Uncharacterized protein n=1 Tax=Solanum lycopersicum TaxID=4081 RepID=A0A3Q7I2M0_SOLLC